MVFDHIGFNVTDFTRTKEFLVRALGPLNIGITSEGEGWAMIGRKGEGQLWVGSFGGAPGPIHVAFSAKNREEVRRFHAAALAAGGKDNGAPGLRPQYHPNYYGAFVIGPDGHNIEAVCHAAEAQSSRPSGAPASGMTISILTPGIVQARPIAFGGRWAATPSSRWLL